MIGKGSRVRCRAEVLNRFRENGLPMGILPEDEVGTVKRVFRGIAEVQYEKFVCMFKLTDLKEEPDGLQ